MRAHTTASLALLSALATVSAETIHGVTVFSRHGDRTSKHYKGYTLTNLGFTQNFDAGAYFRSTYLDPASPKHIAGISSDVYSPSQIYASAPDQMVLLNTATAFLQGLYPPLSADPSLGSQALNNGTNVTAPLNGYQYVVVHGEEEESPDTIWLKGDDGCPAQAAASGTYNESAEFSSIDTWTRPFYNQFWPLLENVYDLTLSDLSYANAYDVFDLVNTARLHNASFPDYLVTDEHLTRLRQLADSAEFAANFNASQPARSIGGQTLAAALLKQLQETVSSAGATPKFSLLAGSYDTFLAFFGLTGLADAEPSLFRGLPDYASTLALELFTAGDATDAAFPSDLSELSVRFLFRNGSAPDAALTTHALFGSDPATAEAGLSWPDFEAAMSDIAITDVAAWCTACSSEKAFCATAGNGNGGGATGGGAGSPAVTKVVAGLIGGVVVAGVALAAGLACVLVRRRRRAQHVVWTPATRSRQEEDGEEGKTRAHVEVLMLPGEEKRVSSGRRESV